MADPTLFQPFALRELTLSNRIVVSPMCQYSAEDGSATDWHVMHLGALTQSGAALTFIEATAVNAEGRITPGCLGLYSDANEDALRRVLAAIRPHASAHIGVQLAHAGRKASSRRPWEGDRQIAVRDGGWTPQAPSMRPFRDDEAPSHALKVDEIARIVADFALAARRADRLGLDAIELHCAHGYLLHEFLSPVANRRDDAYGGSLANRMRAPLEVFDAVRAAWPVHKPLGVRVSASDWLEHEPETPSWTLDDTVAFARELKQRGCDWIDASSGGISPHQKIAVGPGYQLHFAERIRREVGLPVIGIGLITEPAQAEAAIAEGRCDLVAMARAFLWNPRWGWHAAANAGLPAVLPPQYLRAVPRAFAPVFAAKPSGAR
ncbi:MAG: NADH:flavin oxidoreductase/NADH oxidase [Proteobacteria bacterium]|nr:NADH:flavin oxidoreductase/NADH oxidase [Pseudomonadota bacterium]